jgi:hypothetical protein
MNCISSQILPKYKQALSEKEWFIFIKNQFI